MSADALTQLRSMLAPSTSVGADAIAAQRERMLTTPTPLDLLNPDALRDALANPALQAQLPSLLQQHAPTADRHPSSLPDLLRSPALRSQAASLSSALQTEQADGLLQQFGLADDSVTEPYGVKRLLDALLALQRRQHPPRE